MTKIKVTFRANNGQMEILKRLKEIMSMDENSDAIRFCIDFTAMFLNAKIEDIRAEILQATVRKSMEERIKKSKEE